MSVKYRLDLLTKAGVKVAEIPYLDLQYRSKVNEPGLATFIVNPNDVNLANFVDEAQIEIWYKDDENSIAWYRDFVGLIDASESYYSEVNKLVVICPGIKTMLSWRINDYAAGRNFFTQFADIEAENLMKILMLYNFGTSATVANGRTIVAIDTRIIIAPDLARGNLISRGNANKNILEELQYLASIAGGDFDLNKTAANQFTFEFYLGQRGTNRTSTVLFALERGNISNVKYSRNRVGFKSVAIIKGMGQLADRNKTAVTGNGYSTSNHREVFVDANNEPDAALTSKGTAKLFELRVEEDVQFKVIQSPSTIYRKHYFLGDLISSRINGVTFTQKVNAVTVKVKKDGNAIEDIDVELLTL